MNALSLKKKRLVIDVGKLGISHVNVRIRLRDLDLAVVGAIRVVVEDKSAISVAKLAISPAIAQRVVQQDTVDILVEDLVEGEGTGEELEDKHAIPVADMGTCPVTAPRGKSVTTVSGLFYQRLGLVIIFLRWGGWSPQSRMSSGSQL